MTDECTPLADRLVGLGIGRKHASGGYTFEGFAGTADTFCQDGRVLSAALGELTWLGLRKLLEGILIPAGRGNEKINTVELLTAVADALEARRRVSPEECVNPLEYPPRDRS